MGQIKSHFTKYKRIGINPQNKIFNVCGNELKLN